MFIESGQFRLNVEKVPLNKYEKKPMGVPTIGTRFVDPPFLIHHFCGTFSL